MGTRVIKKNSIGIMVFLVINVFLLILSIFSCSLLNSFYVDKLAFSASNYLRLNNYNNSVLPIMSIQAQDEILYSKIIDLYSYDNRVSYPRIVSQKEFSITNDLLDFESSISVATQLTFRSTSVTHDSFDMLEGANYFLYPSQIYDKAGYWHRRYNANAFCYASDILMNKIIDVYNLRESKTLFYDSNGYDTILSLEDYSSFTFFDKTKEKSFKISINRVLASDRGAANSISKIQTTSNPLILISNNVINVDFESPSFFEYCFQLDLHLNAFGITRQINNVRNIYGKNIVFELYSYDYNQNRYYKIDDAQNNYIQSFNDFRNSVGICILAICFLICPFFYYFQKRLFFNNANSLFYKISLIYACFLIFLGIICNYIYVFYLTSLFPIYVFILLVVFIWKGVKNERFRKNIVFKKYFELQI